MAGGYCYIRREHRELERKVRDESVHARRHPRPDCKVAIGLVSSAKVRGIEGLICILRFV